MGFDPQYSKYEPGMYLVINVIEELCRENQAQKAVRIDFGIGDSEWKTILGNQSWCEESVCIFAPTATAVGVNSLQTLVAALDRAGEGNFATEQLTAPREAGVAQSYRARVNVPPAPLGGPILPGLNSSQVSRTVI